jgi:hypothetical protein
MTPKRPKITLTRRGFGPVSPYTSVVRRAIRRRQSATPVATLPTPSQARVPKLERPDVARYWWPCQTGSNSCRQQRLRLFGIVVVKRPPSSTEAEIRYTLEILGEALFC